MRKKSICANASYSAPCGDTDNTACSYSAFLIGGHISEHFLVWIARNFSIYLLA